MILQKNMRKMYIIARARRLEYTVILKTRENANIS